jgi:alpha-N-arabinofuranosidase
VSSTIDNEKRSLSLAVVNRHQSQPIATAISLKNARTDGNAQVFEINGASAEAENSFSQPNNVGIEQKNPIPVGSTFNYTFPAHSITLLKLEITPPH